MSTMTWFSQFAKGFTHIQKRTAQYLTVAACTCVLVKAQTATNYIVGYWEGSGTPNVTRLTHLNYAFGSIVANGSGGYTCTIPNALPSGVSLQSQFQSFKTQNPKLKILISIGGEGHGGDFTNAMNDPNFAAHCVSGTLGQLGGAADGIDIDWEFPQPGDQTNFINLMSTLRSALPSGGLLTAAVGNGPTLNGQAAQNASTPFSSVTGYVNFFNVMAYDTDSDQATTFTAPLFAPSLNGYQTWNGSVNATINDLITNQSVPPSQIVLGIPFYGKVYPSVLSSADAGLYQTPASVTIPDPMNPGSYTTGTSTSIPYNQIVPHVPQHNGPLVAKYCDAGGTTVTACPPSWGQPLTAAPTGGSQEAWLYDSNNTYGFGPSVTTFDDPGSMAAKVKYALGKGLGGVMVWELSQDTAAGDLLNAIANSMPSTGAQGDTSLYNFESGAQGWTTSTAYTQLATSTAEAFLGQSSLGVTMGKIQLVLHGRGTYVPTFEYSPATVVYVSSPAIPQNAQAIRFHIWVPSDALLTDINPFIADSNWNYLAGAWTASLTLGSWNTFQVQVPAGSHPAYLGVEFDSSAFWMDTCYIDSVTVQ